MSNGWFVLVIFSMSFLLTALLRKYALAKSLIDVPNERSSHSVPTPRGGGVAIVVAYFCALALLYWTELAPFNSVFASFGGGVIVAIVGFIDDHGHVAARWRLLGHTAGAIWALAWLGGLPPITLLGVIVNLGWLGQVLAVFYLVWMLNLYNFMDGIDGIASVEAICVCLGACLLYWIKGLESLIWEPLLLAAAVAGFLYWNAPSARIFMGDAGSGFLGIILGLLSIQAARTDPELFWAWLILLGVFVVDATFTLVRRLIRGERLHEAHRSHAYQFASRRFGRHSPVTVIVGLITIFWLLPIAIFVVRYQLDGVTALLFAYAPLILLAWRLRAGERENESNI
ncbi:MraY family glycosyltransferase [Pseudomonas fluorescens]|uniref:Undecaprenyl-phosphate alpha-N-acetylglucosaminyl 1-phosphate transferase n=1 Tax=Pseudomonas fluorescens TaxID=294 RepID=A0A5E7RKY5_PSEFL|nr:glycosyltransferase family 4 protein [Pseudomonas fluorescens]VVP74769.1 Undecaprenyl-phosphate alpha-N-acetylglucosaminyl 1-phosphate transferase [Pseudomonas fluorescens]